MSEVLSINNSLLLTRIDDVIRFDHTNINEFATLANSLIATMIKLNGIGLAANQVGKPYRAFAMFIRGIPEVLFNPKLLSHKGDIIIVDEGCLSYPSITKKKSRFSTLEVMWRDYAGTRYQTWLDGIDAVCFQHELNHLNGKEWND